MPGPSAAAGLAQPELPVPNYDDLSVASLRARLRNLDLSQVRVLLEYEKDHAGRAAVLTMFERRIAKLERARLSSPPARGLTAMPLETTPESPVPVRTVLRLVGEWVGRLGRIWVEGQIAELNRRGSTVFLTLRDPVAAVSARVVCSRTVFERDDPRQRRAPAWSSGPGLTSTGPGIVLADRAGDPDGRDRRAAGPAGTAAPVAGREGLFARRTETAAAVSCRASSA